MSAPVEKDVIAADDYMIDGDGTTGPTTEPIELDEYLGVGDAPASSDPRDFLAAALRVAGRGYRVFPISPGAKKPPLIDEWQLRASSDPEQIRAWWLKWSTANVGLVADDLVVVDVDPRNGGDKGLEGLEALYGALPDTGPAVRTGGGGVHIYFRSPGGPLSSSTSKVANGVDIKTGLGYVVLPPSVTTGPYEWIRDLEQELPEVPGWLLEKLTRKNTKPFAVPTEVTPGQRNDTLYKLGRSLKAKGLPAIAIGAAVIATNQDFKPPLPDAEVELLIANVLSQPDRPDFAPPAPSSATPSPSVTGKIYRTSDSGNAERFRDQHRHHARYCPEWKSWLTFDGRVWREDVGSLVVDQMMKQSLLSIYEEAKLIEDEKKAKARRVFAFECENRWRRSAALDLARSEMPVYAKDLDANPWVLNCQNGLLDLKTLELRPTRAEEFCTKITNAAYRPEATDPTWDQFLEAKIPDPELRRWLPKLAGHALTGERDQDIMGNPNGPTRSGKTTFCGALREAMGDYAVEVDANLFMLSSHGLNHNGETNQPVLATLKGIRLVVSAEANDTMRLDEAKVKKITGKDEITAAAKYKKPITFKPTFLWLLHGNERVRVTVDDDAIWRRIKQIPFKESTAEAEVKEEIRNRLLTDQVCHDAVLRWAVDGLRRFQADGGLKPFPKAVEMETNEYRAAMNPLADFVRDYCVLEENAEVLAANLRVKYTWWCDAQNLPVRDRLGDNDLAKHLKRLKCEPAKERGGERRRTWVGIRLKEGQS